MEFALKLVSLTWERSVKFTRGAWKKLEQRNVIAAGILLGGLVSQAIELIPGFAT